MKKKKEVYTVTEATEKLMRFCAYQERCHYDVEKKLNTFQLTPLEKQKVISNLISDDFLNEERFVKAFVNDKFKFNKWGKNRIRQELKIRRISTYLIDKGLDVIDEKEYLSLFQELLINRWKKIPAGPPLKRKQKLFNYLYRRGFETELIYAEWDRLNL